PPVRRWCSSPRSAPRTSPRRSRRRITSTMSSCSRTTDFSCSIPSSRTRLSKVGVVKVWWECRVEVERETYLDQPDDAFALIVSAPNVEIIEHSEREIAPAALSSPFVPAKAGIQGPQVVALGSRFRGNERGEESAARPKLHDVTIEVRRTVECARVEGVTPEEFAITRRARTIKDADYCFHDVFRTQSQLIAQGYDREQVKKLPSYTLAHTIEEQARDTVNDARAMTA